MKRSVKAGTHSHYIAYVSGSVSGIVPNVIQHEGKGLKGVSHMQWMSFDGQGLGEKAKQDDRT